MIETAEGLWNCHFQMPGHEQWTLPACEQIDAKIIFVVNGLNAKRISFDFSVI